MKLHEATPIFVKHCVAAVAPQYGGDTDKAFAICVASMQDAGYLKPGTMELTGKGEKAAARHAKEKDAKKKMADYEKILKAARKKRESSMMGEIDPLDEGYHRGDGKFHGGYKGASLWSKDGNRFRVVVNKEGRHWKVPVRGRLRSEMSRAERRKAEQRDARRKKLGRDTALPEGYHAGTDELDAMMDPVEREELFMSPLDGISEASDVQVDRASVEFAPGQEPNEDWSDKEFVTLMGFEFDVSGKSLARLLGKQQRALERALEKMKPKDAIRALQSRAGLPLMKDVFREAKKFIQAELVDVASNIGWDGAKVKGVELADDTSFWEAKIDPKKQSIHFRVEVDVLGNWIGKVGEDVVEEVLGVLSKRGE